MAIRKDNINTFISLIVLLLCTIFIAGCGQSLKSSWNNFRSYYNTYYNAKESYQAGLAKVREQPFTIEPGELVRIHHAPVQAGNSDFQEAIDKGAKILRKFPESKWVDDAILLIGKSYYYRLEFYPAQQKFEELKEAVTSPEMEQLAIIWKGRTLLDLELHAEGITYLEAELQEYPADWSAERKAEVQTLIAQHHAMLENWKEAAAFLSEALPSLEDKQLLGRTHFLHGQMLERLEDYGDAYFAFSRTAELFPGFEYRYWGLFKQADIARKQQNLDLAIRIYEGLSRDDKYIERRGELAFEIARTLEMKGEIAEAEKRYKELLYGSQDQNTQHLRADIYFRLGEIYSDEYEKLSVAAAYYDSSSSSKLVLTADENQDPENLADAFGEYKRLRNDINRADSLLRLGSLSEDELEAELEKIRNQKRRELREQQQAEAESERLANINDAMNTDNQNSTSSSRFGFLNYRNTNRVSQSRAEFRAVWGNRPLVDNWRRVRTVRRSGRSGITSNQDERVGQETAAITLDLEAIPGTPEEKRKLEAEKINKRYELGNLLFFELDSPDEAKDYFHMVINSQSDPDLRPRAMYSLYELYKTSENIDSLQYWRNQLLQEYPDTEYTHRIQDIDKSSPTDRKANSTDTLLQRYQQIENDTSFESGKLSKAAALRELALENRNSELASHIHYKAVEAYINQAKVYDNVADSLLVDPVNISEATGDTIQSAEYTNPQNTELEGAYWDSVRVIVEEFDTTFAGAEQHKKVKQLKEMLTQESKVPTCEETGISLSIKGGMNSFLSTVNYPDKVREMSVSGQVVYSFVVIPTGEVKSFELVSQPTSLGIEEAFEQAFKQNLRFEPLKVEDPPPSIQCEVSFPIDH